MKLLVTAALVVACATPASAGQLSSSQQQQLTSIVQQLLGPPPSDGAYGGVSVTANVEVGPNGRTDCTKVKVTENNNQGRVVGVAQRWKCPNY